MKVLIVSLASPPAIGAASSRCEQLRRLFEEEGQEVQVVAKKELKQPKSNLDRLFLYTMFALWYPWKLRRSDVIVFTSPYSLSPYSWAAILYGRLTGAFIILDNVDLWPEIVTEVGGVAWCRPLLKVITLFNSWLADEVSFTFPSLRRRGIEFGVPEEKAEIIPLKVDAKPCLKQGKGGSVVYCGTLAKRYDFETLVRAAEMLPKVNFVIMGEGPQAPYLQRESKRLWNFWFVEGFLSREEYLKLICGASICVCLNIDSKEAQTTVPTKVLEWLAMGKKVICTENPDIAETDAYGIKPYDAPSLAHLITELLEN